jgi:hypothetical protein
MNLLLGHSTCFNEARAGRPTPVHLGSGRYSIIKIRSPRVWRQVECGSDSSLFRKGWGLPHQLAIRVTRAFPSHVEHPTSISFPVEEISEPIASGCAAITEIVPAPEQEEHATHGTQSEIVPAMTKHPSTVEIIHRRLKRRIQYLMKIHQESTQRRSIGRQVRWPYSTSGSTKPGAAAPRDCHARVLVARFGREICGEMRRGYLGSWDDSPTPPWKACS